MPPGTTILSEAGQAPSPNDFSACTPSAPSGTRQALSPHFSEIFEHADIVLAASYAQAKSYNVQRAQAQPSGAFGVVAQVFAAWIADLWELYGDGRRFASPVQSLAAMRFATGATGTVPLSHLANCGGDGTPVPLGHQFLLQHHRPPSGTGVPSPPHPPQSQLVPDALADSMSNQPNLARALCSFVSLGSGLPAFEDALDGHIPSDVALATEERTVLDVCRAYREQLQRLSLLDIGQAVSYILAHASEIFLTPKRVCMLSSAPLPPLQQYFLSTLADAGYITFTHCADDGTPYIAAPATMRRANPELALQFAFPSGRYAQGSLVARIVHEHASAGPVVVACKQPLQMFSNLSPAFCQPDAGGNAPAITASARGSRSFTATDFGQLYTSVCAAIYEPSIPWDRASLVDALRSPLLNMPAERVWHTDKQLRGNRHANKQETLKALCEEALFASYYALATQPTASAFASVEQSFSQVKGYTSYEIQEQRIALEALQEVFHTLRASGVEDADIVPAALDLLPSVSIDTRVANYRAEPGNTPQVVFTTLSQAARLSPPSCATLVVCDLDTVHYPASERENAATQLLDKLGVPKGERAIEKLRRDWVGLLDTPSTNLVLMRCLNDEAGDPTYPCAMVEEFIDCYRADVSTSDDIDNVYALPEDLQKGKVPGTKPLMTCGEEDLLADVVPAVAAVRLQDTTCGADGPSTQQGVACGADGPSTQQDAACREGEAGAPHAQRKEPPTSTPHTDQPQTASDLILSPSQIEAYLSCPFKWFMQRRLHVASLDEGFDAAQAGTYRHDVMQRFLATFGRKVTPDVLDEAAAVLEDVMTAVEADHARVDDAGFPQHFNRYVPLPGTTETYALDLAKAELRAWLVAECDFLRKVEPSECDGENGLQPIDFRPVAFEFDLAPFHIPYAGATLSGRIDRIDVDAASKSAVVVDYKGTLSTAYNLAAKDPFVGPARKLQALVYAAALQQSKAVQDVLGIAPDSDGLCVVAELYMSYKAGNEVRGTYVNSRINAKAVLPTMGSTNKGVSAETFAEVLSQTEALVERDVVDRIRAGEIAPRPADENSCTYCSVTSCAQRRQK